MSASRKRIRKPGRKQGARINQCIVLNPLNVKMFKECELKAEGALLALRNNCANEDHLISLNVLHEITTRMTNDAAVIQHAFAVDRICTEVKERGYVCSELSFVAISTSAQWLIRWLKKQSNCLISSVATHSVKRITNQINEVAP